MFKKHSLVMFCLLYLIFSIVYALNHFSKPEIIGWTTFIGETGMDILIFTLSFHLYYTHNKKINLFGLLGISYLCESIADSSYNLIQNVFGISNLPAIQASIFEIPLIFFLLLQTWIWYRLLTDSNSSRIKNKASFVTHIPLMASSFFLFTVFLYFAGWKINRLSGEGIYQLIDVLIEASDFALVSICLAASANKGISSIAIGFLSIVCSNYMIRLPVVELVFLKNSPFEFTWIIGQILVLYGLLYLKQNSQKNSIVDWCHGINSLQSKVAIGGFCLVWSIILLFSIFCKCTLYNTTDNANILKYSPPLIIVLSIITVVFCSYFSKKLLRPLKELELIILNSSIPEKFESTLKSHYDYGIREYIELKVFIKKALSSLHEQFTLERQTSKLAAGVAHDIASPLAYMEMTLHNANLPIAIKNQLKSSIQGIRNITCNLLERYRNPINIDKTIKIQKNWSINNISKPEPAYLNFYHMINEISAQKEREWSAHSCNIKIKILVKAHSTWIYAAPFEIKRIISNLLNNAYEALQEYRKIEIFLDIEQQDFLSLSISDTGCGIPNEYLSEVLEGKSLKHCGEGLGLQNAKKYIEFLGGKIILTSQIDKGTQVKLLIPRSSIPSWLPNKIVINNNHPIIVLDDDKCVSDFWQEQLKKANVNIFSFNQPTDFLGWYHENINIAKKTIYLFDHQLHDSVWTGISLLDKIQADTRGYLITSEFEDSSIQKYCTQQRNWLLPKIFKNDVPLKIINH